MPIGAVIGAGVLTAGATVATGAMASHAQQSAAQDASQIQVATANENNQLARDMYDANASRLDPYSALGLPAGAEYNGLLGIAVPTGVSASTPPGPRPPANSNGTTATGGYTGPSLSQILAMQYDGIPHNYANAMAAYNAYYAAHPQGSTSALAPFGTTAPTSGSALSPVVAQQAQAAIAAGADPNAVRLRAAQYGVSLA